MNESYIFKKVFWSQKLKIIFQLMKFAYMEIKASSKIFFMKTASFHHFWFWFRNWMDERVNVHLNILNLKLKHEKWCESVFLLFKLQLNLCFLNEKWRLKKSCWKITKYFLVESFFWSWSEFKSQTFN